MAFLLQMLLVNSSFKDTPQLEDNRVLLIILLPGIHYGHDEQPYTPDELVKWLKNIYVFQLFYVISVSVVKFSM